MEMVRTEEKKPSEMHDHGREEGGMGNSGSDKNHEHGQGNGEAGQ
jgi:hypothetical protein